MTPPRLTLFLVAVAAACNGADPLPPLGADPSAADIEKHAALHCNKVASCSFAESVYPECMEKMQAHVGTAEERRSSGMMLTRFEKCLVLDCTAMTICFNQVALDMARDQGLPSPPKAP